MRRRQTVTHAFGRMAKPSIRSRGLSSLFLCVKVKGRCVRTQPQTHLLSRFDNRSLNDTLDYHLSNIGINAKSITTLWLQRL